jgi:hypothetical protein
VTVQTPNVNSPTGLQVQPGPVPHHSVAEWRRNGYLVKEERCKVKGCGLPFLRIYWPNDPPYHIDPQTMRAHSEVCCDARRVAEMIRREDVERRPAPDGKSAATGEGR